MGVDPITSSWIASEVSDKTGNDASLPLAVTAAGFGNAAQQFADGNYLQGAQTAAQTAAQAGPAAATGGAAGGAGGLPWMAILNGATQLYGQHATAQSNENVAEINNRPPPTVPNPYYDAVMTRAMGILDKYMQSHGISPTVGINPGESPTALGSSGPKPPGFVGDQNVVSPTSPAAAALGAAMNGGATMPAPSIKDKVSKKGATDAPKEEDGFTNAAMAAQLGARRMGLIQDQPMFPTTRDFYEADQERKKEELKKLNEYIYGQRSLGV